MPSKDRETAKKFLYHTTSSFSKIISYNNQVIYIEISKIKYRTEIKMEKIF